jgi:50S ribosomal subunit-associated GTPase HflX
MGRVGEENALFISATNKENFEELRERLYEVVREIYITRFPYNKFYILIIKMLWRKKMRTSKKRNTRVSS